MPGIPAHWAEVLELRPEVTAEGGQLANLQMSLYAVVSATQDVPYRDATYYCEITEPTPGLVGFMGQVAQRLGTDRATRALFHLDQGMGGGKSHALVGLYHMASDPELFFEQDLGRLVLHDAEERAGTSIDLKGTRMVVLPADHMSPGVPSPGYGPGTTLHERFIWSLFPNDFDRYHRLATAGQDKAALKAALTEVGGPVLILLDELMDYAQILSDGRYRDQLPGERGFLNALMDAVDEIPRVAFVLVMIRSDKDEHGYHPDAEEVRAYVTQRIERNGVTASVTEAEDLAAIIRRRLFQPSERRFPVRELATAWEEAADAIWREKVFDRLPSSRSLIGFEQRLADTYPFHPDLMALVQDDWSKHSGFQKVRSTMDIFAASGFYWVNEHKAGRYTPPLIGVGDLPLHYMIEAVLSSGLLHSNERAVRGFRSVAASDVTSKDRSRGRAVELDGKFAANHPGVDPALHPCVVMATALLLCSLVARSYGRHGAITPELLAAVFRPGGLSFNEADEALTLLLDETEGLGSLEVIAGDTGAETWYLLTVSQTLRMYHRQARELVGADERDEYLWDRVQEIANRGAFDRLVPVETRPPGMPLAEVFRDVDESMSNRLVVLDPRRWTLGNGREDATRTDVTALLGLGPHALPVDNAASVVVAGIDVREREKARTRAREALAYRKVQRMLAPDDELRVQAERQFRELQDQVADDLRRAYRHYAFLTWDGSSTMIEWARLEGPTETALSGNTVWGALVQQARALQPHGLTGEYLVQALDLSKRAYTLREVVRTFWQNSALPLVPSETEVRRAIFDAVSLRRAWQILGAGGEVLTITSPESLAINSAEQTVRLAEPMHEAGTVGGDTDGGDTGEDRRGQGPTGETGGPSGGMDGPDPSGQVTYLRHTMRLPSRSLTNPEVQDRIWELFSELATVLDPAHELDVQLVEVGRLNLTAAAGVLTSLRQKAEAAGATWTEESEDF